MANRGLLALHKVAEFKSYLEQRGLRPESGKAEYEVLRWKGKPGKPMPIVFNRNGDRDHLSCNDAAVPYVRAFIREGRHPGRNELMQGGAR